MEKQTNLKPCPFCGSTEIKLITLYALINLINPRDFTICNDKEFLVNTFNKLLPENCRKIFKMQCRIEDIRMDE